MMLPPLPTITQVSAGLKKKKKKQSLQVELALEETRITQRSASSPAPLHPLRLGRPSSAPARQCAHLRSRPGLRHHHTLVRTTSPVTGHQPSHPTSKPAAQMEVGTRTALHGQTAPVAMTDSSSTATYTPVQFLSMLPLRFPGAHAPSTLQGYTGLAIRFEAWAAGEGKTTDLWSEAEWVRWISSLDVRIQGKHQYMKTASAILSLPQRGPLQMAMKGQVANGALVPHKQAPALRQHELLHPALSTEILGCMVCWKTASRWDEVSRLHREAFMFPTHEELAELDYPPQEVAIIDWLQETKASRCEPHRASRFAVITGSMTAEIKTRVLALPPKAKITNTTTAGITRLLKVIRPELSAHSFKAGALDVLAAAVVRGQLSEAHMARLAKHKHPADPAPTTLRYIRNLSTLALMLGTQEASACL